MSVGTGFGTGTSYSAKTATENNIKQKKVFINLEILTHQELYETIFEIYFANGDKDYSPRFPSAKVPRDTLGKNITKHNISERDVVHPDYSIGE